MNISIDEVKQLSKLVQDNPDLLTMLKLLDKNHVEKLVLPVRADKLVGTTEALDILKVSEATFRGYWQKGLIEAYYTPDSRNRKFWLSDVMAIPRKEAEDLFL